MQNDVAGRDGSALTAELKANEEWVRAWFAARYQSSDVFLDGPECLTIEAACELVLAYAASRVDAKKDAERYRWLKSRDVLDLHSQPQPNTWLRIDGTPFNATHYLADGERQYSQAEGLDATIDAAMAFMPKPVSA